MEPAWRVLAPRRAQLLCACQLVAAGLTRPGTSAALSVKLAHEHVVDSHVQVNPLVEGFSGGAPKVPDLEINLWVLSNLSSENSCSSVDLSECRNPRLGKHAPGAIDSCCTELLLESYPSIDLRHR